MLSMRELSLPAERSTASGRPALVATGATRKAAASVLRAASRALDRLAERLALLPLATPDSVLEFHAEAGAPEGALYVDGRLVGHVSGVTRL